MGASNMIDKPKLERRERIGEHGEIVVELTQESERKWAEYLHKKHLALVALANMRRENEQT